MKLYELLLTCQNQWKGLFGKNEDFRVELKFEERSKKENEQSYFLYYNYTEDKAYLEKYKYREINFWEMKYKDNLYIEIRGHY